MDEAVALFLKSVNSSAISARAHRFESLREANRAAFGEPRLPQLRFAEAKAIYVFRRGRDRNVPSPVASRAASPTHARAALAW
jgi:hypothetical protein